MATDASPNIELKSQVELPDQGSNGNLLHVDDPEAPQKSGKHARFNIEKVDSPTSTEHPHTQATIGHEMDTIGYATHEAVPLTMFYRNDASMAGKAKARPTLEELHKGFDELDEMEVCNILTFCVQMTRYLGLRYPLACLIQPSERSHADCLHMK